MFVVGTAGHVDHGKSTLVRALTGIDPDRLAEEKAREMTIDLGFAWLTLPSGRAISLVDVPGHERFIKNMLAGVGGIDAALLVVAADEGVMPQTAEHLAILDLLGVGRGVVVLAKSDLADPEWLELVREETRERLLGTSMERAPLVAISARTGAGLPELLAALDDVLADTERRPAAGTARLPVDRAFSVRGFGAVITGTLLDGPLRVGQEARLLPSGRTGRVRGLQTHNQSEDAAEPGRRLAVNLGGVAAEDIRRGEVLVTASWALEPSVRFDARVRLTADAPRPLRHGSRLDLFAAAAETTATVALLDRDALAPGESGYAQLRTRDPLVVARGDRFILRQPSPSLTIGGGVVLEPRPRRRRRKHPDTLAALEALERGTPEDLLLDALARSGPADRQTLLAAAGRAAADALDALLTGGELMHAVPGDANPGARVYTPAQWDALAERATAALAAHHQGYPLRLGMPREELGSRLGLDARRYAEALAGLAARGAVVDAGATVRLPGWEVRFEGERGRDAARVEAAIRAGGRTPPAPAELGADPELLAALAETGRLARLTDTLYYAPEVYAALAEETLALLDREGAATVARVRDALGLSRKYVLALLEHMDARGLTRRRGDERVRADGDDRAP